MNSNTAIQQIQNHANNIRNGGATVCPGKPLAFSNACTPGDAIAQGDLLIEISNRSKPPKGFVKKSELKNKLQLVHGNTEGAKHCLESLDGVDIYYPKAWNAESLVGPFFIVAANKNATVLHPVHGSVTIPGPACVEITYQREYDKEQQRERRAKD